MITNTDDSIDSREIIETINDLTDIENAEEEEQELLDALKSLADQCQQWSDWPYGVTLIRDSFFIEYAQDLAEDIGAIDSSAPWPNTCIDWDQAACELQQDYTPVDFDGETYWINS